jgi:hypothetical protein
VYVQRRADDPAKVSRVVNSALEARECHPMIRLDHMKQLRRRISSQNSRYLLLVGCPTHLSRLWWHVYDARPLNECKRTHTYSPPALFSVSADETRRDHYPPALELVPAHRFAPQPRKSLRHPPRRPRSLSFALRCILKPMRPPPGPHRRHRFAAAQLAEVAETDKWQMQTPNPPPLGKHSNHHRLPPSRGLVVINLTRQANRRGPTQ